MTTTPRDIQRSKLYKAERTALVYRAKPLPTTEDVERYLRQQAKRVALSTRYGNAIDLGRYPVAVGDGRGTRRALAHGTRKITLPLWARTDWVALHEFAHIIHNRLDWGWMRGTAGSRSRELHGGAAHGWQYAAIYLDLVHFCMGVEAAAALKASFKRHKVRFTAPRAKRPATPEQIARLAVLREAAKAKRLLLAARPKGGASP